MLIALLIIGGLMPVQFRFTSGTNPPRVPGYVETLEDWIAADFERRGLGVIVPLRPIQDDTPTREIRVKPAVGDVPNGAETRAIGRAKKG